MSSDRLTARNAACIIITSMLSTKIIIGFPMEVGQDTWIALILSMLMALPIVLVYARMIRLMPGRDIYGMAEAALGKPGARIVGFLFGFYMLHLAALVLNNYAEFINLTSLFHTPLPIIALLIFMACLYLAKSGVGVIGKWCVIILTLALATMLFITVSAIPVTKFSWLMPMFTYPWQDYLMSSLKMVPLPYGEFVLILILSGNMDRDTRPYRLNTVTLAFIMFLMVVVFVRTCTTLGIKMLETVYFPTYKSAALIQVGSMLERVESFLAYVYILAGIPKAALCVIAAARGAARVLNIPSEQPMIVPVGMLSATLSVIVFRSIVDMFDFTHTYLIYSIPFQFVIPLVIWVAAEIRSRRGTLPEPVPVAPPQPEDSGQPGDAQLPDASAYR